MKHKNSFVVPDNPIPADIVLAPRWWYNNTGLTFDKDFFFHPDKRVESERLMEQTLYERWGEFGLGRHRNSNRPEVGAVHLAAGFMLSGMLGCRVDFYEDNPPQVQTAYHDNLILKGEDAFRSDLFKDFENLNQNLKKSYGFLSGDVNWGGILNIAFDLRGQDLFTDMLEAADQTSAFLNEIKVVINRFVKSIQSETGTSSISVNRNVSHIQQPVFLHSECTHTMISENHYKQFLFAADVQWNNEWRPFGLHYCGDDPHRFAALFKLLPSLDFLDVGWGGNIRLLRKYLPNTFLNLRLSPVGIISQTPDEICETIRKLVSESGDPWLTGICCINMDDQVRDEQITAIFDSVRELRKELL
jgi:hypothetical protein